KFSEQAQKIPGIESVTIISGRSIISGAGSNYGFMMIKMEGFKQRNTPEKSADAVIGKLFGLAGSSFPDAKMIFFQPPSIPGFGMSGGFDLKLLDRSGADIKDFDKATQDYIAALMQRPEILYAQTSLNTNYAQYE